MRWLLLAVCAVLACGLVTHPGGASATTGNWEQLCRDLPKPAPGRVMGTVSITAAGVNTPWNQGPWKTDDCTFMYHAGDGYLPQLDHAASHYPANAMPWQNGTVVISGHRVSHTQAFLHLGYVRLGDLITLTSPKGPYRYRVIKPPPSSSYLYDGWNTSGAPCVALKACAVVPLVKTGWVLTQWHFRDGHYLVLLACTPPGQKTDRLVVFAKLV